MTAAENNNSTLRTNAAGEKYSLRGIYGSEPYWPEAKLKICVTGAGGFIGAQSRFLFAFMCDFELGDLLSFVCHIIIINLLVSLSRRGKAVAVETFSARFGVRARLEKERAARGRRRRRLFSRSRGR